MKKRTKTYQPKPVKNTLHLFNGRAPADPKDATTLKLVYRLIFERVRTGAADEADLFAMASLLENLHIAVEYSSDLDNKEATFAQLRQAASLIMHAVRNHRSALSGVSTHATLRVATGSQNRTTRGIGVSTHATLRVATRDALRASRC